MKFIKFIKLYIVVPQEYQMNHSHYQCDCSQTTPNYQCQIQRS
ncbi:unnamed protein product [Paramecium sonneborni]|uniref:Uncharacterized protein n=1 Tax=Paramecium sonneborni TaxID=65129 RepID=A0A8S1QME3_9CILI|nr:unnamed protein product [Paramecium sonneborni]